MVSFFSLSFFFVSVVLSLLFPFFSFVSLYLYLSASRFLSLSPEGKRPTTTPSPSSFRADVCASVVRHAQRVFEGHESPGDQCARLSNGWVRFQDQSAPESARRLDRGDLCACGKAKLTPRARFYSPVLPFRSSFLAVPSAAHILSTKVLPKFVETIL